MTSMNFSISIPMMYMANLGASQGWSHSYTDADSVTNTTGESISSSVANSVSESVSHTVGESIGRIKVTVREQRSGTEPISLSAVPRICRIRFPKTKVRAYLTASRQTIRFPKAFPTAFRNRSRSAGRIRIQLPNRLRIPQQAVYPEVKALRKGLPIPAV